MYDACGVNPSLILPHCPDLVKSQQLDEATLLKPGPTILIDGQDKSEEIGFSVSVSHQYDQVGRTLSVQSFIHFSRCLTKAPPFNGQGVSFSLSLALYLSLSLTLQTN